MELDSAFSCFQDGSEPVRPEHHSIEWMTLTILAVVLIGIAVYRWRTHEGETSAFRYAIAGIFLGGIAIAWASQRVLEKLEACGRFQGYEPLTWLQMASILATGILATAATYLFSLALSRKNASQWIRTTTLLIAGGITCWLLWIMAVGSPVTQSFMPLEDHGYWAMRERNAQ